MTGKQEWNKQQSLIKFLTLDCWNYYGEIFRNMKALMCEGNKGQNIRKNFEIVDFINSSTTPMRGKFPCRFSKIRTFCPKETMKFNFESFSPETESVKCSCKAFTLEHKSSKVNLKIKFHGKHLERSTGKNNDRRKQTKTKCLVSGKKRQSINIAQQK
ncbi:CLUMA_CG010841, isoform A [Clunio marinus]|uniref:CLUMA_CG010841, isoform A n=1 Tax=Clunio marinus TaxID=568069 RepID=A0A1J1ID17_9DIPT|nr:CLUMA_CG010841, isoform A [Clunio marinus]